MPIAAAGFEISAWSQAHGSSAAAALAQSDLGVRSGLATSEFTEILAQSVAVAQGCAVVGTHAGRYAGHVVIEPSPSAMWQGTWWTLAHSHVASSSHELRAMWAAAAQSAANQGARDFYVNVAANDPSLPAWHSLSFGIQHVVATLELAKFDEQRVRVTAGSELHEAGPLIGRATVKDAPALARLEALLPAALAESPVFSPVSTQPQAEAEREWRETLEDEAFITMVARAKTDIVGFALLCSAEKSSLHSGLMRLPGSATLAQVNVEPAWRRRGLGAALATQAIDVGLDSGFTAVVTDWRSTNIAADAAWRALGFVPTAYRLQRVVGAHG